MIRANNMYRVQITKAAKIIGKIFILALDVIAVMASDEKKKPQYTAIKATQLYEDGLISGTEFAENIHGN
ncbi:TPA: hypothetical protein ACGWTM_002973 [Legionella pneumophila]